MKFHSLLAVATLAVSATAFSTAESRKASRSVELGATDRRSMLVGGTAALLTAFTPAAANAVFKLGDPKSFKQDPKSVINLELRSFEDLIYNFKNTALDGGLDASKLNEPSIPFIEFGEKMKNGEVTFVEFIAPSGEVAYATLKGKKDERVRIGQGYPTLAKTSWSSPDYVIRSVSNFGVPYKFTVPALEKYKIKL